MGGGTRSGTPVETRGASRAAGQSFENLFLGPGGTPRSFGEISRAAADPFLSLGSEAVMNNLGVGQELLESLAPIQARQRAEANTALGMLAGSQGARFGPSILEAGAGLNADLSQQFNRQNLEALFSLVLPALTQSQNVLGNQALQAAAIPFQFAAPGAAIHDPGLLPSLIQAGGTVGGALALGSSVDFKEGIEDREDTAGDLERVGRMKVKNYRYTGEPEQRIGLIIEDEGTPDEIVIGKKAVDVYSLVGILLNATKELKNRVAELEEANNGV